MAHKLTINSNGLADMAYVGETPWHGLGTALTNGTDLEQWKVAAGLDYEVLSAPVMYLGLPYKSKRVLYRSDTEAPLSVVSDQYKTVQPSEVIEFFRDLVEYNNFEMETAGSLLGGKKIWALARAGASKYIGNDEIRPYVLLATSFDSSLSTIARFTSVRVVCNNTLTISLADSTTAVRVNHCVQFDPKKAKLDLGLVKNNFHLFMKGLESLANQQLHETEALDLTIALLKPKAIETDKGLKKIMAMFNGELVGHDKSGGDTKWTWLNAITEYVDHSYSPNTFLFGTGELLKNRALALVTS